jgi:hypothetical protein
MKKTLISRIAIFFTAFIVIMACSRNDSSPKEVEDQISQAQNEAVVEAVLQKADDHIDKEIALLEKYNYNPSAAKSGDTEMCKATITVVTPANAKFPKTITLDYGDGCKDSEGNFRAGKVVVSISGAYWAKGTTRQAKLVDYKYNDIKIAGLRSETNKGTNDKGYFVFEVNHSEKIWKNKDELLSERNWERKREYNRGKDLTSNKDDELWVTGSAKVKNNGKELVKEITVPLYRKLDCQFPHFQSGVITTYFEKKKTGELNYGKGECDNTATFTNKDGVSKTITLQLWINHYTVKP